MAMVQLYCRGHHPGGGGLCPSCAEMQNYALCRLHRCPFGVEKPTCAHCPIHCYKPEMRQRVREVMRYSGPRMLLRHPILALWHFWDGRKRVENPRASKKNL